LKKRLIRLLITDYSVCFQGAARGALSPASQKASTSSQRKRGTENAVAQFFRTIVSKPLKSKVNSLQWRLLVFHAGEAHFLPTSENVSVYLNVNSKQRTEIFEKPACVFTTSYSLIGSFHCQSKLN
uniref:Uncharacterized protein n=1 Tax=Gouania willdenowi TaxID=441366 RepID=A0A8C5G8F9_GOUWI